MERVQFYRNPGGEEKASFDIKEENVRDFWNTMWNNTECEKKDYSEYLREHVPGLKSQENCFPSMLEFIEIIKFLPNWKRRYLQFFYQKVHLASCKSIRRYQKDMHEAGRSGGLVLQRDNISYPKRYTSTRK